MVYPSLYTCITIAITTTTDYLFAIDGVEADVSVTSGLSLTRVTVECVHLRGHETADVISCYVSAKVLAL